MKNNIAKTSNTMDKLLKILQGFAIAGIIVSVIMIVFVAILGEKMLASASSVDLGNVTAELIGGKFDNLNHAVFKSHVIGKLVMTAIACASVWYIFRVLRELLVPMKADRPFAAGVSGTIRKLAIATLIGGGLIELANTVRGYLEVKLFDLDSIFNMAAVSEISPNLNINLWFFFAALILFFLSYVFRRGEELQREEDETL